MTTSADRLSGEPPTDLLRRELEKAIASGISKRTPEQIRAEVREQWIIESIERGRADMNAGNTVPREVAMAELDAVSDRLSEQRTECL